MADVSSNHMELAKRLHQVVFGVADYESTVRCTTFIADEQGSFFSGVSSIYQPYDRSYWTGCTYKNDFENW